MGFEGFNKNNSEDLENKKSVVSGGLEETAVSNFSSSESRESLDTDWRFEKQAAALRFDELKKENGGENYENLSIFDQYEVTAKVVKFINENVGEGDRPVDNSLRFVAELAGEELDRLNKIIASDSASPR